MGGSWPYGLLQRPFSYDMTPFSEVGFNPFIDPFPGRRRYGMPLFVIVQSEAWHLPVETIDRQRRFDERPAAGAVG